jgi:ElaB/YqjD/DUF883 family membrane-anchored ribosome-binding protein
MATDTKNTETIKKDSADAYERAEQAVNETVDTTTQKVGETYEKAKNFSNENPGKTIFIALGIGIGLGLLLSNGSGRSRTSRIAEPVVNALSDIAREFIR